MGIGPKLHEQQVAVDEGFDDQRRQLLQPTLSGRRRALAVQDGDAQSKMRNDVAHTVRVVLIQMSFYQYDNRYMLDSLRRFPGVFSGVGIVDEQAPRPQDRMRELAAQGVRGFRITPGSQSIDAWLGSPGMAAMWQAGADQGLALCPLIGPAALPPSTRV